MKACCADEIWKPIPGYEGYDVSTCGRVRSYRARSKDKVWPGWYISNEPQRILSGGPTGRKRQRRMVILMDKNGHRIVETIHRLVLLCFVGKCPGRMEACHNDGNPSNNHLSNLRYDTHKNNLRDMIKNDKRHRKLKPSDVKSLRLKYAAGASREQISTEYDLSYNYTCDLLAGRRRQNAGGPIGLRHRPGGAGKLTMDDVVRIRHKYNSGSYTYAQLGNEYAVSIPAIFYVVKGYTYNHVSDQDATTDA